MKARIALAALVVLTVLAPAAAAHANYLRSEPARGERLETAPQEVTVVLSERIDPAGSGIEIVDAQGNRMDQDDLRVENGNTPTFRISMAEGVGPGAYSIRWWALSTVDQHTTSGSVGFAVGGFDPPESTTSDSTQARPVGGIGRGVQFAGFALLFGAAAFLLLIDPAGPRDAQAFVRRALRSGAGIQLAGVALLTWDTWQASGLDAGVFAASEVGRLMLLRCGASAFVALLAAVAAFGRPGLDRVVAFAAILPALGSSRFGHASVAGAVAITTDLVHLLAVAVWTGGLFLLVAHLMKAQAWGYNRQEVVNLGLRFSRVAVVAVVLMAITGVLLSIFILGLDRLLNPRLAFSGPYRSVLTLKILLAAGMIGIASLNRFVFLATPGRTGLAWFRALAGRASAGRAAPLAQADNRRGFAFTAAAEAVMGATVIILAAILTSLGAPGQEAQAEASGMRLTGQGNDFLVVLRIDPEPSAGAASQIRMFIREASTDEPVTNNTCGRDDCVRLTIESESGPGSEVYTAQPEGDGWWTVPDVLFVRGGNHTAQLSVQTAYVYEDLIDFEFQVQGSA